MPALTLAFWRMFAASGILWGYSITRKKTSLSKENLFLTGFAGLFLGLHFTCFFWGVRNTSIANATLLANTGPFFTALFAFVKTGRLKTSVFLGLGFSFLGLIIVQTSKSDLVQNNTLGNLVSLLSGLFLAITYNYAKKIRKESSAVIYGRTLFLIASLTIFFIWFAFDRSPLLFNRNHFFWILFLGLVPSILGHNSLNYSIKYLSPTAIASIPLGEPIIASLLGYIIFFEPVPQEALIGAPFVFLGIYMILKNQGE